MAVGCHVVYVTPMKVSSITGQVVDINDNTTTIREAMQTEMQMRVVPNANVPSSALKPTIETYLELEAAGDYILGHISNTMIVTYEQ